MIEYAGEVVGDVRFENVETAKSGFDSLNSLMEGGVGESSIELVNVAVEGVEGLHENGMRLGEGNKIWVEKKVVEEALWPVDEVGQLQWTADPSVIVDGAIAERSVSSGARKKEDVRTFGRKCQERRTGEFRSAAGEDKSASTSHLERNGTYNETLQSKIKHSRRVFPQLRRFRQQHPLHRQLPEQPMLHRSNVC
jgi:hypothetical protein